MRRPQYVPTLEPTSETVKPDAAQIQVADTSGESIAKPAEPLTAAWPLSCFCRGEKGSRRGAEDEPWPRRMRRGTSGDTLADWSFARSKSLTCRSAALHRVCCRDSRQQPEVEPQQATLRGSAGLDTTPSELALERTVVRVR